MLELPEGLTTKSFLADYWQRKPLLMRQALALPQAIDPDELAGLACEDGVESRIVIEHAGRAPWEVRHGPFAENDFAELPDSHWTLLVQDVDKLVPAVAEVRNWFRFVPDWRIDDIMISYAADQGSVGPHTDAYDVFLIQADGRRRWQIHQQAVGEEDLITGLDLRILKHFEAEQEWVLEPGDVLYLPPGVAHWGVALGECTTWSVGFRAPSAKEMAASWLESRLSESTDRRYGDAGLSPPAHPGEISASAIADSRRLVDTMLDSDSGDFARWFCGFVSEPKEHLAPLPSEITIEADGLRRHLLAGGKLRRHPAARLLFHLHDADVLFAASGEVLALPSKLMQVAQSLCDLPPGETGDFTLFAHDEDALALLVALYDRGQIELDDVEH